MLKKNLNTHPQIWHFEANVLIYYKIFMISSHLSLQFTHFSANFFWAENQTLLTYSPLECMAIIHHTTAIILYTLPNKWMERLHCIDCRQIFPPSDGAPNEDARGARFSAKVKYFFHHLLKKINSYKKVKHRKNCKCCLLSLFFEG